MTIRENIRADVLYTLRGIEKMRRVSDKFIPFQQVLGSDMPYSQAIPSNETRKIMDSNRGFDCVWDLLVWIYVEDVADLETWIGKVHTALYADRTRGGYARQSWIAEIESDDRGLAIPGGVAVLTLRVEFREREP